MQLMAILREEQAERERRPKRHRCGRGASIPPTTRCDNPCATHRFDPVTTRPPTPQRIPSLPFDRRLDLPLSTDYWELASLPSSGRGENTGW